MNSNHSFKVLITGGSGKTTIAHMLNHTLKKQGVKTRLVNLSKTKQASFLLKDALVRSEEDEITIFSLPLSTLASPALDQLNPAVVIVTNTWPSEENKDMCRCQQGIARFFHHLNPASLVVLNADCLPALALSDVTSARVVNYSLSYPGAMAFSQSLQLDWEGASFQLNLSEEIPTLSGKSMIPRCVHIKTDLPGKHNASNALAAALLSLIITGDDSFAPAGIGVGMHLPRRGQPVCSKPMIIDDMIKTVQAMESWLELAAYSPPRNTYMVYSPQYEKKRLLLATAAVLNQWHSLIPGFQLVLTGNRLGKSGRDTLVKVLRNRRIAFCLIPSVADAIDEALSLSGEKDLVLLGGGSEMNRACFTAASMLYNNNRSQPIHALPASFNLRQGNVYNPT